MDLNNYSIVTRPVLMTRGRTGAAQPTAFEHAIAATATGTAAAIAFDDASGKVDRVRGRLAQRMKRHFPHLRISVVKRDDKFYAWATVRDTESRIANASASAPAQELAATA